MPPGARAYKWLKRRSKWAAALFALLSFAGCSTQGAICVQGEPPQRRPAPEHVIAEAALCVTEAAAKPE